MLYTFYKIVCKDENITDCYVGSTTNFYKRKIYHKGNCNNINDPKYTQKNYTFIRDNGNWENWEMIIIDTIECETRKDAHKKENEYMIGLNATLNTYKAPAYTATNRNEYMKEYHKENKKIISEKVKQYYIDNKEKKLVYAKEYRAKNREKINENLRQYYHKNK
jgi:hypothetical protein